LPFNQRVSIIALTISIHVGLVLTAHRFAESSPLYIPWLTQTISTIAVKVVARRTASTDSVDPVVLRLAYTSSSDVRVVLIDSLARDNPTSSSVDVISISRRTFGADPLNDIVPSGAITLVGVVVVDLISSALNPAD